MEDTRWQQRAVCAEPSRALPTPRVPMVTPASPSLGHRPRSGQGCGRGDNERDTHPCALEEMGAGFPWGFLGVQTPSWAAGIQGGEGRECSRVLAQPSRTGLGGAGRVSQPGGGRRELSPCPGHIGVPGVYTVQAGPRDLAGQDRGTRFGAPSRGCSLGVLLLWGPWEVLSAWHGAGWHQGSSRGARDLPVPCSSPAAPKMPGLLPLSSILLLLGSECCPLCCLHRRFCTGLVPRVFFLFPLSYPNPLQPPSIPQKALLMLDIPWMRLGAAAGPGSPHTNSIGTVLWDTVTHSLFLYQGWSKVSPSSDPSAPSQINQSKNHLPSLPFPHRQLLPSREPGAAAGMSAWKGRKE